MSLSFMDRISEPDETTPLRSTPDASWQERQRFPSEFVGLWVCKDGSFYDGSTIEIGSNHWCPLRPTGIVKSSAVYSWRVVDGRCQLVDTRGAGESYVYNLSSCHDGTLEVITQSESWYLVRARHRRTSKTVSPAQPEMLGQIVHTKGRQVCLLFSTVSILVCVFLIGTFEEDWSVITAIYVLTQCLLTIGFGDVAVTHDITKMSLSLLMLSSLVTIAFIAKQIVDVVVQKKTLRATTKATELQMKIVKGLQASAHAGPSKSTDPTADDRGDSDVRQILVGVAPFVCSLAFGTIFYATYEACTCSYGSSRVPHCSMDTYEACVETGGYVKTWLDSFYMSVSALTTTGLGNVSPMSEFGRAIGIIWMLSGVASMVYMIQEVASYVFNDMRASVPEDEVVAMSQQLFDIIGKDGDGTLSRSEYRWFVLLKHNLVSKELLESIDRTFDTLALTAGSSPSSGRISLKDLEATKAGHGRGSSVSREPSEDV
mmetsp:Transcript_10647/g.28188  ORF Transcript_10647/g.28188 Transcript_10647/m.28188 type:complete len:486 (-) Transcript_10647:182-1639(-)